eukprot:SAG31_NODE_436_length_15717_cov_5.420412_18_plen_215_part_00
MVPARRHSVCGPRRSTHSPLNPLAARPARRSGQLPTEEGGGAVAGAAARLGPAANCSASRLHCKMPRRRIGSRSARAPRWLPGWLPPGHGAGAGYFIINRYPDTKFTCTSRAARARARRGRRAAMPIVDAGQHASCPVSQRRLFPTNGGGHHAKHAPGGICALLPPLPLLHAVGDLHEAGWSEAQRWRLCRFCASVLMALHVAVRLAPPAYVDG